MKLLQAKHRLVPAAVLLSSLALVSACGKPQASQAKVVNGEDVGQDDLLAKSTVALVNARGAQFCTGTLIEKRHVVTAAHCRADFQGSFAVVFAVTAKPGESDEEHTIAGARFNANRAFDRVAGSGGIGRPANDVALVTLAADAPSDHAAVPMLSRNDALDVGQAVTVAGYGLTSGGARGTNGVLRQTSSEIIEVATASKEFVLGNSDGRACSGDSGGPAYVQRDGQLVLAGIVSRGENQCQGRVIYTDIRYFLDWINHA